LAWDIAVDTAIPLGTYLIATNVASTSEFSALAWATAFPILRSVYGLVRRREASPVALLVLLGLVVSIAALLVGGDPRILLIRESFVTGAFGVACLISLAFPRPIMFYFGRYFMTRGDPLRRTRFEERLRFPSARRAHRIVTAVWGLVYTAEFAVRTVLVYRVPATVVIALSPVMIGTATMLTIMWTFRYARRVAAGLPE
jgi:hypothetical protein